MVIKIIHFPVTRNAQHFQMYKQHLIKKRVKVLYELSCVAKEERNYGFH